ncbi:hypothetical protein [Stenotrophomonas sepilia]
MNQRYGTEPRSALRSQYAQRIAVIPERYGVVMSPCASIRLHAFTEHFPADVRYLIPEELDAFAPHVVLWNRGAVADEAGFASLAAARRRGARLLYDLDDNLLAMDEHPERDAYAGIIDAVRRSIDLADVTWCSTVRLAEVVDAEGGTAVCMPNALDDVLWQTADPSPVSMTRDAELRLLYMGTRTHDEDFRLLDEALQLVWARKPRTFSLTLVGVNAEASQSRPWLYAESPPPHVGASYPAFVHWFSRLRGFHLGLAPLLDTRFNLCKSSIKVLDYASAGMVTLASNVPAYRDDAMNDRILVDNTPEDWAQRIAAIIDGALPLGEMATHARQRVGRSVFQAAVARRWGSCLQSAGD